MSGSRTGPKPRFDRRQAIDAALQLRLDEFTMSQVATALGVATSALYRLFNSRDELLAACLDRILEDVALDRLAASADVPKPWPEVLHDYVEACWAACERYPGLAQVIMYDPKAPARATTQMQALIDNLGKLGISPGQALFALDFLGDIVFATHIAIQPYRNLDPETLRADSGEPLPFEFQEKWCERGNLDDKVQFVIKALANDWPTLK